jgi:hypothetical protein
MKDSPLRTQRTQSPEGEGIAGSRLRTPSFSVSSVSSVVLFLALLAVVPACKDDSYAVISVLTYSGDLAGVAQFRVHVGNGGAEDALFYSKQPRQPSELLVLDAVHPVTFSVEFSTSRGGQATFEVEPLDVNGASLGYGRADASISKGKVFHVTVLVVVGALRPERGLDAGTSSLTCDPYAPELACGAGQTCGLLCAADEPAIGMCYAAGVGKPGGTCASNNDCSTGSQCFTFVAAGCQVMTCLRFCQTDSACGEQGAYCNVPIHCGNTPDFAACSRPCDPTGSGTLGCATGLGCFVYPDETTDCACAGLGALGAACTQSHGCNGGTDCAGCSAGLSCVVPAGGTSGDGVCRPICTLATPVCPSGTTCHAFDRSTRLLYGVCE